MTQTLRETSSIDVGCYRTYAGAIGSSPAWQGVLAAAVRVATRRQRAARRLGLTRTQLYGRLKRYDLEADSADVALA